MLCRFLERIPREVPRNILQINQPNICLNQFLLRFFLLLLHHHLLLTPIVLHFLIVALLFFCRAGDRFLDIRYLACAWESPACPSKNAQSAGGFTSPSTRARHPS